MIARLAAFATIASWFASIVVAVYFSASMTKDLPTERIFVGGQVGCCLDVVINPPWQAMALGLYAVFGFLAGAMILETIAKRKKN